MLKILIYLIIGYSNLFALSNNNGINILYFLENENSINNKLYNQKVKSFNFSIARFPGGEVADNYNWKTNTMYKKYKNVVKDPIDFDTFMLWKRKLGIKDTVIVVNLEQGLIENDIEKYADLAAQWVYYANKVKLYDIKYWEIGNESYLKGTRYSISASEYAKAVKIYSQKMKAVDPTIKIGVNGPHSLKSFGFIDKLSNKDKSYIDSLDKNKRRWYLKSHNFRTYKILGKEWWRTLKNVDRYFDFLSLHTYIKDRKDLKKSLRNISKLKRFFPSKDIAVTEYSYSRYCKLNKVQKLHLLKDIFKSYLYNKNFIFVNYWPLRYNNERALIDENFDYTDNGMLLKKLSR